MWQILAAFLKSIGAVEVEVQDAEAGMVAWERMIKNRKLIRDNEVEVA